MRTRICRRLRLRHAGRVTFLLLLGLMLALGACQPAVVVLPGREGPMPEGPVLGPSLGEGSPETCAPLREQLAQSVELMDVSFQEVRRFVAAYDGDLAQISAFESGWRASFVAQKSDLFPMATCDDFVAQWGLALAAWRDIFRYEKESVSALREGADLEFLNESEEKIMRNLSAIQEALGP